MATSIEDDLSTVTKETLTTDQLETGGTLPRDMFEQFWTDIQEQSELLDMVRTEQIENAKTRIPILQIGERVRRGQAEAMEGAQTNFSTDFIDIDAEKGAVYWSLSSETVEDNPEGAALANKVLGQMTSQFSADTQDLGINGDEAAVATDFADPADHDFVTQNTGWIQLARNAGVAVYDHSAVDETATTYPEPQPIDNAMVQEAISTLPEKYRSRTDPVLIMSSDQLLQYHFHLTDRNTPLGDNVLMGDGDVSPYSFDIVGAGMWPNDVAMFTDPQNLGYALKRDVEVDVLQNSDDIHDLDLFAKYALRGRDDFWIENPAAAVLVENIADPLA